MKGRFQEAKKMDKERLQYLLNTYRQGALSPEEVEEFYARLGGLWNEPPVVNEKIDWDKMFREVVGRGEGKVIRMGARRRAWWAAAAILLLVGLGAGLFFYNNKTVKPTVAAKPAIYDAKPGKDGAVLTLANGQQIVLDSLGNGLVAKENSADIILQNGKVLYKENDVAGSVVYNTMSTPRGRQFQLKLPDGTEVWLNASSSIRYPTVFNGKDRRVEITGEAYFEVAKDKEHPFYVNFGKGEVRVLGTHFNVNAYADEPVVNTTLLEGKVLVSAGGQEANIAPGEQASFGNGKLATKNDVDLDGVMAWKNGSFQFDRTSLEVAMRQLSRWYDIDIVYEQNVPDIKIWGEIKRDLNLSEVLKVLSKMGVHYRIEEKKLVILP